MRKIAAARLAEGRVLELRSRPPEILLWGAVPSAPGVASVRVGGLCQGDGPSRGGRPPPEGVNVAFALHKLRNLERKAPKHALAEIRDDFHRIVYAAGADAARAAYATFERIWGKRCPGTVTSLREGGDELLTFFIFPKAQWRALRSTNVIERLHGEFRRRVKTQGSLPSEDAAIVLLFGLVGSGHIKLRKIDGWRKIAAVLSQQTAVAA